MFTTWYASLLTFYHFSCFSKTEAKQEKKRMEICHRHISRQNYLKTTSNHDNMLAHARFKCQFKCVRRSTNRGLIITGILFCKEFQKIISILIKSRTESCHVWSLYALHCYCFELNRLKYKTVQTSVISKWICSSLELSTSWVIYWFAKAELIYTISI